ncbi:hypothetical protein CXZ05_18695 [Arthrobacter sp. AFG20]|nr:hypothetical protein CXZ05_18695 [Arthrobacter sp. AFG20]
MWPLADLNNEQDDRTLDMRRIKDWTILSGASVEIQQQGSYICAGYVDAVTDDGKILGVTAPSQNRRLFEKAEFYEAWAIEDRDGFHYEVTKNLEHQNETP